MVGGGEDISQEAPEYKQLCEGSEGVSRRKTGETEEIQSPEGPK